MNAKDAVTKRFQKLCKERNMTLNELANLSSVTPSTLYSKIDERRRDISILTIKKFCDGLEMSLADFFHDEIFEELEPEIK